MELETSTNNLNSNAKIASLQKGKNEKQRKYKKKKTQEQEQEQEQTQTVGFFQLFRFAETTDYILILVGTIAALAMGAALPAFALIWGEMTDAFAIGGQTMVDAALESLLNFIYIGIGSFVAGWLMFACWMISGERQSIACRKAYLKSLLKQQIGWFDMINQSELSSKFTTDCFAFSGALGEKVSTLIMTFGMFVAGFIIAFTTGWLMTLVVLATLPAIGLSGWLYIWAIESQDQKSSKDYAKAGGMAEQALSSIKTVKQLNGELFQEVQYEQCLVDVTKKASKYGAIAGAGIGALFFAMLASYGLGFWYGSHCVEGTQVCDPEVSGQKYTAGDVLVVFFSILMAGFNLSQLTPSMKKIAQGRQAASRIFKIIDRQPKIFSVPNAKTPQNFKGIFKFENVTFSYPKDPSRKILDNLNLEFNGDSSALVGESGCGKSTIFQLIMRFYDPDSGKITLDGINLKQIDLKWLRENIGYVGQQPVLFATTIKENLLFGKQDATQEEINEALRKSQAYDFIQTLDEKLETYVGVGGGQLSGGQKQRVAIARALLRNPKILLLDEATSALDRKNERLIQSTLDKISAQRTTLTIAHRANTIMSANTIYVLDKGKVIQKGKFNELSRFKGHTYEEIDRQLKQNPAQLMSPTKLGKIDLTMQLENKPQEKKILTKQELEKKQMEELVQKYQDSIFGRLFSYASDEKLLFVLGILVVIVNGLVFPAFTIFLSEMLTILIGFNTGDIGEAREKSNLYALIYVLLGVLAFFANLAQMSIFSYIGQKVTKKIRKQAYAKMLRMPIPWFDIPKNNSGSLTSKLASDCKNVNGMVTTFIAISIQNVTTLIAGLVIGFIFEWRTSLVALGLIPLMIIAGAIQMEFTTGFSDKSDAAYKQSSNMITESMINIRTVSSFGYQNVIYNKYEKILRQPFQLAVKKGNCSGLLFGFSQIVMFLIFGLIFYIGTIFIRDNEDVGINDVFTAIYAITFSAMTAGNNAHFLPDMASGKNSAASLFQILDSEDQDQKQIAQQSKLLKSGIKGQFELKNIEFKYLTRNNYVFEDFSLKIDATKKIAFVGHSGCGKSTIFQLLQRFYEPSKGQILIDGVNIKDYDIHYLRSCFGVVSQEPVLFNGSFKYNIIYNKQNVTEQQMISAAKQANALSFIEGEEKLVSEVQQTAKQSLSDQKEDENKVGFDKSVGIKGSHISGGQKQRVAIARAILRNPSILFLDEATSALDSANQKKVQASLDQIMKDRTTISIAHRIDTIKNSDTINVFEKGQIVQSGTYADLVSKKGYFYNLERGTDFL